MTGEIAAAGDIATGALMARAVEPDTGAASMPGGEHSLCLNCATALAGPYCHACGQTAHIHRTLGSIGHDLLHGVLHFEGKIGRTLPMLVLRPGELTRRYIAGERARFVSPLALFLFSVFVMFASYSVLGPGDLAKGFARGGAVASASMDKSEAATIAAITRLERARAAATGPAARRTIDRQLAAQRADLATTVRLRAKLAGERGEAVLGVPFVDHGIAKLRANPQLVLYKAQSSAYKFSWALIVLSTPLVALLFAWRRRFTLYDHAVFATYSITFMSLLAIVLELLVAIHAPRRLFVWTLWLAPIAHMFAQLRGAYRLSVFAAAWRTVALAIFAVTALLLFVLGVIAVGAVG